MQELLCDDSFPVFELIPTFEEIQKFVQDEAMNEAVELLKLPGNPKSLKQQKWTRESLKGSYT